MGAASAGGDAAPVHPDVFVTIAFAGIAVAVAVAALVLVVPQLRREALRERRHES